MNNAARNHHFVEHDRDDVALTIVPTEFDDPQPFVPRSREHRPVLRAVPPSAPPPAPARNGLLVAGALGGGVVVGGGVVGLLGLLAAGATMLAAGAGLAAWFVLSAPAPVVAAEVAPVAAIVDEPVAEVPLEAAPVEVAAAPEAAAAARPAPTAAPVAPPTPAVAAVPTAVAPAEVPDDLVTVKIITDPLGAQLTVDGVPQSRTPAKLTLAPGAHAIRLEAGKASGAFQIQAGTADRFCYAVDGKRITSTPCP